MATRGNITRIEPAGAGRWLVVVDRCGEDVLRDAIRSGERIEIRRPRRALRGSDSGTGDVPPVLRLAGVTPDGTH